ncbi:MAG TPA: FAD-binding oxidoreductase [Thermoleophilaceae bacterium]|nr:FAD-binding oxidoreductase [Thermoleophilaceae bacterium]
MSRGTKGPAVTPATPSLADIPSSIEELDCYSGLFSATAVVYTPKNEEQLKRIFAFARQEERRVTLRAGGHSFDSQALGADIVISMRAMNGIELLEGERKMVVGPGATWGAILGELEPRGLVPAVTVTTEHATAGGTLAGDCLSRFSTAWGKQGAWIESFRLLAPSGESITCKRPSPGKAPESWTLGERAFAGAIGGLGYLGVVVSITQRLLYTGQTERRIGVSSRVQKCRTFEALAEKLVPAARKADLQQSDPLDPDKEDALYAALLIRGKKGRTKKRYALFFESAYTTRPERRRMALHRPRSPIRVPVEWLMRVHWISWLLWPLIFRFAYSDKKLYIDDLEGYSFFVDGNVRAKRWAKRFGRSLKTIQQTFVVPCPPEGDPAWPGAQKRLVMWLDGAHEVLVAHNLSPTLLDVLYLPKDNPFLLSATGREAGFAVSYAIETNSSRDLELAKQAFSRLSDLLLNEPFRGRVYLVKNVFARASTLRAMYGDDYASFMSLKAELDPDGLLRNDFLERTFGPPG